MFVCRFMLLASLILPLAGGEPPPSGTDLAGRMELQLTAIERVLHTLRYVSLSTEEGDTNRTMLTSSAWFVPGDAVETPVKVTVTEANAAERSEMSFWLDQGRLFLVLERFAATREGAVDLTERRRLYDAGTLVRMESRTATIPNEEAHDLSGKPFIATELPADGEADGMMMEEIALETASQLAPLTVTNRPVHFSDQGIRTR